MDVTKNAATHLGNLKENVKRIVDVYAGGDGQDQMLNTLTADHTATESKQTIVPSLVIIPIILEIRNVFH